MNKKDNEEVELLLVEEDDTFSTNKKYKRFKKSKMLVIMLLCVFTVLGFSTSYALFTFNVTKDTNFRVSVGNLDLTISDTETEDKIILKDMIPTKDAVALSKDGYNFNVENTGTIANYYSLYLDNITLEEGEKLDTNLIKLNITNNNTNTSVTKSYQQYLDDNKSLDTGILNAGDSINYTLRMWLDYNARNDSQKKYFAVQIRMEGQQHTPSKKDNSSK